MNPHIEREHHGPGKSNLEPSILSISSWSYWTINMSNDQITDKREKYSGLSLIYPHQYLVPVDSGRTSTGSCRKEYFVF